MRIIFVKMRNILIAIRISNLFYKINFIFSAFSQKKSTFHLLGSPTKSEYRVFYYNIDLFYFILFFIVSYCIIRNCRCKSGIKGILTKRNVKIIIACSIAYGTFWSIMPFLGWSYYSLGKEKNR